MMVMMLEALDSILRDLFHAWKVFWRGLWRFLNKHCGKFSWLIVMMSTLRLIRYMFDVSGDWRVALALFVLVFINQPLDLENQAEAKKREIDDKSDH